MAAMDCGFFGGYRFWASFGTRIEQLPSLPQTHQANLTASSEFFCSHSVLILFSKWSDFCCSILSPSSSSSHTLTLRREASRFSAPCSTRMPTLPRRSAQGPDPHLLPEELLSAALTGSFHTAPFLQVLGSSQGPFYEQEQKTRAGRLLHSVHSESLSSC